MILKVLKLLTVLCFISITFDTGHIGGQFGLFIMLGFLSDFIGFIISSLSSIILFLFIISSFIPLSPKLDLYIFLWGGVLLLIPIIVHLYFLFSKIRIDTPFYFTVSLYLILYGITLLKIINLRKEHIK